MSTKNTAIFKELQLPIYHLSQDSSLDDLVDHPSENHSFHFLLLERFQEGEEPSKALFYLGGEKKIEGDRQQALVRLLNEGWHNAGNLHVKQDDQDQQARSTYHHHKPLTLELSKELLALVDSHHGAPLLSQIEHLRQMIVANIGFVLPQIEIRDNLELESFQYQLLIHGVPAITNEIFLDRKLVMAEDAILDQIQGWSTIEPVQKSRAKWIDQDLPETISADEVLLLGPLVVLQTQLYSILHKHLWELVDTQGIHSILKDVAHDAPYLTQTLSAFPHGIYHCKEVFQRLLKENLPIHATNLILESVLTGLHENDTIDEQVKACRVKMARQISLNFAKLLNPRSPQRLRGLLVSDTIEEILHHQLETHHFDEKNAKNYLQPQFLEALYQGIHNALKEHQEITFIATDKDTRSLLYSLIHQIFPDLSVLALQELHHSFKMELPALIELPADHNWQEEETMEKK